MQTVQIMPICDSFYEYNSIDGAPYFILWSSIITKYCASPILLFIELQFDFWSLKIVL